MKPMKISHAQMVAKAACPSSLRDIFGDTLGSFSALAIDPSSLKTVRGGWRLNLSTLPDRGFNTPSKGEYSDYPGRLHDFALEIPAGGDARLEYVTSRYLRDASGAQTTGLDPGETTKTHFGLDAPAVRRGRGVPARLSLDAEGLARRRDGAFYVSDEFSCSIYLCDPHGHMIGAIPPPAAIAPRKGKHLHFTSHDDDPPDAGRQPNDGFEGLSLSPDGQTLVALMQSPLVQDLGKGPARQRYVRLVTYDVSRRPCPTKPSGHFVVELPMFDGDGKARVPEANCVLALGGGAILVLARDGGGFGDRKGKGGTARPAQFKRVLQGVIDPSANLVGTGFDQGATSIWRKGELDPAIRVVALETLIDILDEDALNSVGLTAHPGRRRFQQISAKWEGLALSPPVKRGSREHFLLISNDNDFLTRDGMMPDRAYDAGIDNPNMILIYRVMIP